MLLILWLAHWSHHTFLAGSAGQAPAAAVLQALRELLQLLQQGGYICGYQLVWDSQPGGWPGDWATSEPQLVDAEGVLQQQGPITAGSVFQVGSVGLMELTTVRPHGSEALLYSISVLKYSDLNQVE